MAEDATSELDKPRLQSDAQMAQGVPFCIRREFGVGWGVAYLLGPVLRAAAERLKER